MRCPRILAKVICCGLARVRKMDELAKDRFRRLEQTLSLSAGTARFIHIPVVCNTCRDRLSCWATARSFCAAPVTGLICSHERAAAARGLALVMMAMTLAPAISPALGACLAEWFGWRAVFAVLGGRRAPAELVPRSVRATTMRRRTAPSQRETPPARRATPDVARSGRIPDRRQAARRQSRRDRGSRRAAHAPACL